MGKPLITTVHTGTIAITIDVQTAAAGVRLQGHTTYQVRITENEDGCAEWRIEARRGQLHDQAKEHLMRPRVRPVIVPLPQGKDKGLAANFWDALEEGAERLQDIVTEVLKS